MYQSLAPVRARSSRGVDGSERIELGLNASYAQQRSPILSSQLHTRYICSYSADVAWYRARWAMCSTLSEKSFAAPVNVLWPACNMPDQETSAALWQNIALKCTSSRRGGCTRPEGHCGSERCFFSRTGASQLALLSL